MKRLNDSLGARVAILCAVASFAIAAPASADATAYLMYLKGSEGPPAVPMRVLWDARDAANGRVTIDLGAKYEPALTKLGLPRVLEYDATLDKSQFVVREGEFVRFVKVVATSIVQGFLTVSPVPGAWAQPAEVKVHTATILIAPAPARLELIARLYVTYLDPQKSGPPKVQDLIKGDIVFVGQPEPTGPGEAGQPSKP
ncbi:MAG TPA: hypothetical protein VFV12_06665 [Xanthobacteraceae bacterium]|nr:hypothetical protein [Xanthobacteraceae bacterium]